MATAVELVCIESPLGACPGSGYRHCPGRFCLRGQFFPLDNQQALALIASGAVPVADLITHRVPLEATVEGIHAVTRGEAIKVTMEA
jgi:threonine dehydrogenase-like Zn-dependent dehydrogenase